MKQIIFLLMIAFALSSCNRNSAVVSATGNSADTTFNLIYHLLVSDTTINAINIHGNLLLLPNQALLPPEPRTWFKTQFSDTMLYTWSPKVYNGFITQVVVSVDSFCPTPNNYSFHRFYMMPSDTMASSMDTVIFFRWPNDTTRAVFKGRYDLL